MNKRLLITVACLSLHASTYTASQPYLTPNQKEFLSKGVIPSASGTLLAFLFSVVITPPNKELKDFQSSWLKGKHLDNKGKLLVITSAVCAAKNMYDGLDYLYTNYSPYKFNFTENKNSKLKTK